MISNYSKVKSFIKKGDHGVWGNDLNSIIIKLNKKYKYEKWFTDILCGNITSVNEFRYKYPDIVSATESRWDFKKEQDLPDPRNVLEFKRDTEISTVVEDMISYDVEGLERNSTSTANNSQSSTASTDEDYMYSSNNQNVKVELKTRYTSKEVTFFRLNESSKLLKNKSLVITYFPYQKTMYIIDFADPIVESKLDYVNYCSKSSNVFDLTGITKFEYDIGVTDPSVIKNKLDEVIKNRSINIV